MVGVIEWRSFNKIMQFFGINNFDGLFFINYIGKC